MIGKLNQRQLSGCLLIRTEVNMIVAKNNIIVKIDQWDPAEYAILNPISGSFDLMSEEEYQSYRNAEEGLFIDREMKDYLVERGYLYADQESYEQSLEAAYRSFRSEADKAQIQLMLIPTYSCNLACTYCFQHGIDGRPSLISKEAVNSFFDYARGEFADSPVKPFITLFGGEPLINSKAHREIIEYIVDKCVAEDYELAAVTNGYDFIDYIDILKRTRIKEIQFTLDGGKEIHDSRRNTANQKGTFDRIVLGIEKAVENGIPVNLRSVVDKENVDDLVHLAEFLDDKGWLDLPPELFKTQIGRNYELFECYGKPEHLFSQIELWAYVARLAEQYPVLKKFHRPDFMGIRYLVETGELYLPSFDTCPAGKSEWVFDLYGDIYGCTASCGREDFKLGTFWPTVQKNTAAMDTWKNRNVNNIKECRECKYNIICGGGCGVVAANKNGGEILSPDCRPIQELYDIGLNFYADELKKLSEDQTEGGIQQGCIICGSRLEYLTDSIEQTCEICGKRFSSNIRCSNGHYICDECHRGDVLDHMERILTESDEKNPVRLAAQIFQLPTLKMHGPEYHSLVPGVLVTTYQNNIGRKDPKEIREAMRRGRDIKGGSCGFHGACGACVGTGVAESVIHGASPKSREERGKALLVTGSALLEIGKYQGPQCCKRDSVTSIKTYMDMVDYYSAEDQYEYICTQFEENKDCLKLGCPYFPTKSRRGSGTK